MNRKSEQAVFICYIKSSKPIHSTFQLIMHSTYACMHLCSARMSMCVHAHVRERERERCANEHSAKAIHIIGMRKKII